MNIKRVPISSVIPWDENPRGIRSEDFERLKKQILEARRLQAARRLPGGGKYVVLGGNMRIRALKELGVKEVEISCGQAKERGRADQVCALRQRPRGILRGGMLAEGVILPHIEELDLSGLQDRPRGPIDLKGVVEQFGPDLGDPKERDLRRVHRDSSTSVRNAGTNGERTDGRFVFRRVRGSSLGYKWAGFANCWRSTSTRTPSRRSG